jgi:hypothetical protein
MESIEWSDNNSLSNWAIVTFSAGREWRGAPRRLSKQCKQSSLFRHFISLDKQWLQSIPREKLRGASIEEVFPRGYGLWHWKPLALLHALERFPDADGVLYLDAGCELNSSRASIARAIEYMETSQREGGLIFELPMLERNYTSSYVIDEIGTSENGYQMAATVIFVPRNSESERLVHDWKWRVTANNYELLIGRFEETDEDLVEHRHDQSILSLMWKKAGLYTVQNETYFAPNWKSTGREYPIWAARNRSAFSIKLPKIIRVPLRVIEKIKSTYSH